MKVGKDNSKVDIKSIKFNDLWVENKPRNNEPFITVVIRSH